MVIGFIAMALIVTGALIGLALYIKWQDALVAQERQSANLARVLQEQTLRVLAPIDQATLRMRDAVAKGSFEPSDFTRLANETGLVPDILTQLGLVGADGRFVASNLDPDGQKTGPVDLSEREHIQIHLEPGRNPDLRGEAERTRLSIAVRRDYYIGRDEASAAVAQLAEIVPSPALRPAAAPLRASVISADS